MLKPPRWLWRIVIAAGAVAAATLSVILPGFDRISAAAAIDVPAARLTFLKTGHSLLVYRWTPSTRQLARFERMQSDAAIEAAAARIELEAMERAANRHASRYGFDPRQYETTIAFTQKLFAFQDVMNRLKSTASGADATVSWVEANRGAVDKLRADEMAKIVERSASAGRLPVARFECPSVRLNHFFASWQPPIGAPLPTVYRASLWFMIPILLVSILPIVLGVRRERRWRTEFVERVFSRHNAVPASANDAARDPVEPKNLVAASRQTRHPRPRWFVRIVAAIVGVTLAVAAYQALSAPKPVEWHIRPDKDWRVLIHLGCVIVGEFPSLATAEAEVTAFYDNIDLAELPSIWPSMRARLQLLKRVEMALPDAQKRGVRVIEQPGAPRIVAIAGWVVALMAAPFASPLVRGVFSLWVRRRRLMRELCPTCAYPLVGLPSPRCPECGERVDANVAGPPT